LDSLLVFAAEDPSLLTTIFNVTKAIVLVVVGVNMLIIVHEWGHFIVARMCGVRCEKFYIWFDIFGWKFFKFKWGDTEYGLGVLPLGGYVKMLGQEDNPGRLREELDRAKAIEAEGQASGKPGTPDEPQADSTEATDTKVAEENSADYVSPARQKKEVEQAEALVAEAKKSSESETRVEALSTELAAAEAALTSEESYLTKSVPQRMAIISAGVIMNVIFAFFLAVVAYGMGVLKADSEIGRVAPGGAAWCADIRVGDRTTSVAGKPISQFDRLREATMLGDLDDGLPITLQRPGVDGPVELVVHPDEELGVPTIGIAGPNTTTLGRERAAHFDTPAYAAEPALEPGDRIVAINGQPVSRGYEIHRAEAVGRDAPMTLTLERNGTEGEATETITATVAVRPMRRLGLVMTAGPIGRVQANSPAATAGLKPGEKITAIDDEPIGDPLTLEARLRERAAAASEGDPLQVRLQIEGRAEPVEIALRPVDWYEIPIYGTEHPSVPSLGITIEVTPRVAEVLEGSPAETAGIKPGDVVAKVRPIVPDKATRERYGIPKRLKMPEKALDLTEEKATWAGVFYSLQDWLPGCKIELTLTKGDPVLLEWRDDPNWNHPERGFQLSSKETLVEPQGIGEVLAYGLEETQNSLMMVFQFIGKVSSQQISPRMMGGPLTIVKIAYFYATQRFTAFLLFLCVISANLAVINFLPIPVLDGGHMVFLSYEGIRGKPPSENVQIGLSYVGLFLLLGLMVWVFGLDFGFISRT